MTEKVEYKGKVLSVSPYAAPMRQYYLGGNCDYPQYVFGERFSFSRFLSKFEGKKVHLMLEVIE